MNTIHLTLVTHLLFFFVLDGICTRTYIYMNILFASINNNQLFCKVTIEPENDDKDDSNNNNNQDQCHFRVFPPHFSCDLKSEDVRGKRQNHLSGTLA